MTNHTWTAGQRVVLGRDRIVTIDRVTPSGRAVIGDQTFRKDGCQIGEVPHWWLRSRIGPITPENQGRVEFLDRWRIAIDNLWDALDAAGKVRRECNDHRSVPDPVAVAKAERIAAAIRAAMEASDGE